MIICFIRYTLDLEKIAAFEHYARVWTHLIAKYGGMHYGYFIPGDAPPSATFSFPGIGVAGQENIGVAIFSFQDLKSYEDYRRDVAIDPECIAVTQHYERTKCFTSYERTIVMLLV